MTTPTALVSHTLLLGGRAPGMRRFVPWDNVSRRAERRQRRWAAMMVTLFMSASGCGGAGAAGGSDAGTSGGPDMAKPCSTDTPVMVSGTVSLHPISIAIDKSAAITGASIKLEDPLLAISGKDAVLTDEDCKPARIALANGKKSDFAFADIDASHVSVGLIATVESTDSTKDDSMVRATTGLAAGRIEKDVTKGIVFAVTKATEAALAPLVKDAMGKPQSPGQLIARGFILGLFLDANGGPIEGVALVDFNGMTVDGVVYPDATFTGVKNDGTTSANGSFVIPEAALKSYTGKKGTMKFASQQAASKAGDAFLLTLLPMP